jgi:hypothetical protein
MGGDADFRWYEKALETRYVRIPEWFMSRTDLSIYAHRTYAVLAWRLNRRSNLAWPSAATIAACVPCSARQVGRAIAELEAAGILLRRSRPGTSNMYQLRFTEPEGVGLTVASTDVGCDSQSDLDRTPSPTNQTDTNQPEISGSNPADASAELVLDLGPGAEATPAAAAPKQEDLDAERVWQHWVDHALAPFGRRAGELTASRKRTIAKAVKEVGLDMCLRAIEGAVSYWTRTKPDYLKTGGSTAQISNVLATNPGSKPLADQVEWWAGHAPERATHENGGFGTSPISTSQIDDAKFKEAMDAVSSIDQFMKSKPEQVRAAPKVFVDSAMRRLSTLTNLGWTVDVDFDALTCRVAPPETGA